MDLGSRTTGYVAIFYRSVKIGGKGRDLNCIFYFVHNSLASILKATRFSLLLLLLMMMMMQWVKREPVQSLKLNQDEVSLESWWIVKVS